LPCFPLKRITAATTSFGLQIDVNDHAHSFSGQPAKMAAMHAFARSWFGENLGAFL
jgi:hypothetical protein